MAHRSHILLIVFSFVGFGRLCTGHATLTLPPSRQGGSLEHAGDCHVSECMWFSQPMLIPGEPTVNAPEFRTFNIHVADGPHDWSRRNPWRAPGAAPVLGSGCGVAGGNPKALLNGGTPPPGVAQGTDGLSLDPMAPHVWRTGAVEEVAYALTANHGGGVSYRLCKKGAGGSIEHVSEACFQRTVLRFVGDKQWLQFTSKPGERSGERVEIPLTKVSVGTHPAGSEWAVNPVPGCTFCDQGVACGAPILPDFDVVSGKVADGNGGFLTYYGGTNWTRQAHCGASCTGERKIGEFVANASQVCSDVCWSCDDHGCHTDGQLCLPGKTQFPEPAPGISGYSMSHSEREQSSLPRFNVVQRILVPTELEEGDYLLSWRWDCEQSFQIWQNCADVRILNGTKFAV